MKLAILILCVFATCIQCDNYSCPDTQYDCRNGECIHKYLVCDKKADCTNENDELGCDPSNVNATISPDTAGNSSSSGGSAPSGGTGTEATDSPAGTNSSSSGGSAPSGGAGTETTDSPAGTNSSSSGGSATGGGAGSETTDGPGTNSSTSDGTSAVDVCKKMFPTTIEGVASQDHCQINCSGNNPMDGYSGRFSFSMNKDDLSSCAYDPATQGVCFGGSCLRGQDVQACNVSTAGQLTLAQEVNSCQLTCWSQKGESYTRFAENGTPCTEQDDTSGYCDGYGNCDTHIQGKSSNFTG